MERGQTKHCSGRLVMRALHLFPVMVVEWVKLSMTDEQTRFTEWQDRLHHAEKASHFSI